VVPHVDQVKDLPIIVGGRYRDTSKKQSSGALIGTSSISREDISVERPTFFITIRPTLSSNKPTYPIEGRCWALGMCDGLLAFDMIY
jgi:hypothetical protein